MLGLSVRVLPLLRREVQMSDVRVEGLNLILNRDEHGHGNWEDIGKPLPQPAGTPSTSTTEAPPRLIRRPTRKTPASAWSSWTSTA